MNVTSPAVGGPANWALAAIGKIAVQASPARATPVGKPEVGAIALAGHGHELLFWPLDGLRPLGHLVTVHAIL